MNPLKSEEVPAIYTPYIETVLGDPFDALREQLDNFIDFATSIPREKWLYAYADGKWTTLEVIGHLIDTERVMAYRALRFARNDIKELSAFDEEEFVKQASFNKRDLHDLLNEFRAVRTSTIYLFTQFDEHSLQRKGIAAERLISVRALLYVIVGHVNHHLSILKERYLNTY